MGLADLKEGIEVIHPCAVSIAPFNMDSIKAYRLNFHGFDIGFKGFLTKSAFASHFIHAGGTGTFESQFQVGKGKGFSAIKYQFDVV